MKDFPKPGIVFKDITPVLQNGKAFREVIDALCAEFKNEKIDKVAAVEARGFIIGGALAAQLGCGFIPIRKHGKLPYKTVCCEYSLEYGKDRIEMHCDAVEKGERVLLVDDLLATGGTMEATAKLVESCGG
ncbi:MAG: adenine phosphoribosyltransferase, partial [Planctomycetota bacterium]|nr:adenine phosphoribosyltransferase [Planctomycetota bacterium]